MSTAVTFPAEVNSTCNQLLVENIVCVHRLGLKKLVSVSPSQALAAPASALAVDELQSAVIN